MLRENRSSLLHSSAAIFFVALALSLTLLSGPVFKLTPALLFFPAIALRSRYGGWGAQLLATVLSAFTLQYFFISPVYSFHLEGNDWLRLGAFGLVVAFCNWLWSNSKPSRPDPFATTVAGVPLANSFPPPSNEAKIQFRANVLSQVSDVVIVTDNNFRITYWNQTAENFYGVKAEEAVGKLRREVYDYRWLSPEQEQTTWETLTTLGVWSGEVIHILKSGEEKWVEATVSILNDEQDEQIGYLAVIRDITNRKQTEETLLISDAALQQMPDAIVLTDLQGKIVRWMGKAEQIFGYKASEAMGQPLSFLYQPNLQENMMAQLLESIQKTGTFFGESLCVRKCGLEIPIETTAKTVCDPVGNPLFIVAINRSVIERKEAEKTASN